MTMRFPRRFSTWAGGALAAGLLAPAVLAVAASEGSRPGLPPVVELGVGGAPATASPSREVLADLLQQLESLQTELRNLRGQVEVQANEIERLKARQRELLADIDRRVSELERRGAAASSPAAAPSGESTAAPAAGVAVSAQEQKDYDAAFSLMKQGFYERAAKGFHDFIAKYPQSALRDNAQYWLGEAYYVVRNFRRAIEEFARVMSDYPKSEKAPDALLKIGYSHYELAQDLEQARKKEEAGKRRPAELKRIKAEERKARDQARENLNQVIARYSGTPAAKSAEQRLARMKQE